MVHFSRLQRLEERLERRKRMRLFPQRRLKDMENPIELYNSYEFKLRFHMYKETAIFIARLIEEDLCSPIKRGVHIPGIIQTLIAIRFYVTNSFQIVVGELHNITQPTVSNIILRVSKAIAKCRSRFIRYPSHEEAACVRERFYEIGNFPGDRYIY